MANDSAGEALRAASAHHPVRAERGRSRRRWGSPAAVALAFVLVACSGDDAGTTEPTLLTAPVVSGASETDASTATSAGASATEPSTPGSDRSADSTLVPASTGDVATSDVAATASTAATASAAETPATTVDAPPPSGDITETVPVEPQVTMAPVALDEETPVGEVRVAIVQIERIEAEARLPGEIAGPALAVRVQVTNDSGAEVDLTGVTVNVFDANDAPASPLTAEPNAPFDGRVAPGQQAAATYVFEFSVDRPQPVRVEITTAAGAPVAVFSGPVQ